MEEKIMQKKFYIIPAMQVVNIQAPVILGSSGGESIHSGSGDSVPPGSAMGRELDELFME